MAIGTWGSSSDVAILSRLVRPEQGVLSVDAAESLLAIRFEQADLDRIHDLTTRNQDDLLTPAERIEMEDYRRVSYLLDLLHSKARRALTKHRATP